MKLIDADKIGLTDFETVICGGDYKEALVLLLMKIQNAPTVDAVPVVRCRNCAHSLKVKMFDGNDGYNCMVHPGLWPGDAYCKWGEHDEAD